MQYTLSIIKPDAIRRDLKQDILNMIQEEGLEVIGQKDMTFSSEFVENFYCEHKEKPFFQAMTHFMTSGPVSVQILKGNDAVIKYRTLMGATNPKDAQERTIRHAFGLSIDENSVHGSDSIENAEIEIKKLYTELDLEVFGINFNDITI